MSETLAEGLPKQINRVREVQEHFKELRGMPNVICEPQIAMMEHSIKLAIEAQGSGDVIQMLKCYEDLKGYED